MADKTKNIEQKLLLIIEEHLKNVGAVVKHLESVKKVSEKSSKSLEKYEEISKKTDKTTDELQKRLHKFGQGVKKTQVFLQKATLTFVAFGAAIGGAVASLAKANQSFVDYALASKNAGKSMVELKSLYASLTSSTDLMTISMQDLAEVFSQFASQSIVAMESLDAGTKAVIGSLVDNIAKGMGDKNAAKKITTNFMNLFPNPAILANIFKNYNFATQEFRDAVSAALGPNASQGLAMLKIMENAYGGVAAKIDENTEAAVAWSLAMSQLQTAGQEIAKQIGQEFGGDIGAGITALAKEAIPALKEAIISIIEWFKKTKDTWISVFKAMMTGIEWLLNAFDKWGGVLTVIGGLLLFPGAIPALTGIVGLVWKIGAAFVAVTGPVGAVIAGIVAVGAGIYAVGKYLGWWGDETSNVAQSMEEASSKASGAFDESAANAERTRKAIEDTTRASQEFGDKGTDAVVDFATEFEKISIAIKSAREAFGGLLDQVDAFGTQLEFADFGPEMFEQMTERANEYGRSIRENIALQAQLGKEAVDAAKEQIKSLTETRQKLDDNLKSLLANGASEAEITKAREALRNQDILVLAQQQKIATGEKQIADALKARKIAREAELKPMQEMAELASMNAEVHKADLSISQALYGTPALGVEAMLNVTRELQNQKKALQSQLATVQQAIANGDKSLDTLKSERKLRTEIKRVTAEQLNMVKDLRDGYLDAVQAQAFASGEFEKIVVTQDKNLGMGLDKNIVKANYLLGQVGEAAAASNASAYRFGAGGYGELQKVGGGNFGRDQLEQRVGNAINNIADETMKRAVKESMDTVLEAHSDVYQQASKAETEASYALVESQNNLKSSIDELANKSQTAAARVAGIQGATGALVAGEAARQISDSTDNSRVPAGVQLTTKSARVAAAKASKQIRSGQSFDDLGFKNNSLQSKVAHRLLENTRKENANLYDEIQYGKAVKDIIKKAREAQLKAPMHQAPQKPTQAQEPTGGTGAATKPSASTSTITSKTTAAKGMGTPGDRLVEASKMMKKAAEALITVAEDIDKISTQDTGVTYLSQPGATGGQHIPNG